MSGIAGIYNSDDQPVDFAILKRMTSVISHRGPDLISHWVSGAVGMGHCMLYTTPESIHESQPLVNESGDLCLTMDGRVDNCAELRSALKSKGARLRDDTDAELVLHSYECWGEACAARILGDFSFAIWDRRRQQLLCVRDPMGNKGFVYYWDGHRFIWASELHQIFQDRTVPRVPNEGMVGEYLAVRVTQTEETLYRDILRLPPAHLLVVRHGRLTKRCYWGIAEGKQIRYRTDDDYAQHFIEVFKEAVRCRLRCHGPVGAHLSGGLDSSSVVSMAESLYREGLATNRGFETFSMVYPGLPCDERSYIREVVERWDLSANYVPLQDRPTDWSEKQSHLYQNLCDSPNGTQLYPLKAVAQEKGFRVMLTGFGGDERLSGSLYYLADLIREGKGWEIPRALRLQKLRLTTWRDLSKLLRYGVEPLLPNPLRTTLRLFRNQESFAWINPRFARRFNLEDRLRQNTHAGRLVGSSKMKLQTLLNNGGQVLGMEIEDRSSSWFGLEQRHPFRDRRMVELSFALPEDQRLREHQKFVLRHAMRGYLPEIVRQRRDKAEFSETLVRVIRNLDVESLFEHLCLQRLGWIDGKRVCTMYKEMKRLYDAGNAGYIAYVWPVWMICAVELWFRKSFLGTGRLQPECQSTKPLSVSTRVT